VSSGQMIFFYAPSLELEKTSDKESEEKAVVPLLAAISYALLFLCAFNAVYFHVAVTCGGKAVKN